MIAVASPPPMIPQISKQRDSGDKPDSRGRADDALASGRRAELRRLQDRMRSRPNPGVASVGSGGGGPYGGSPSVLDRARNELQQSSPLTSSSAPPQAHGPHAASTAGPPPRAGAATKPPASAAVGPPVNEPKTIPSRMPPQIASGGRARRNSDIFPSVQPKSPSTTKAAISADSVAASGVPPPAMPPTSSAVAPPAPDAVDAVAAAPAPTKTKTPTGPVARRLDASFAARGSGGGPPPPQQQQHPGKTPPETRPKSLPPVRQPQPSVPPSSKADEEPPTSGSKQMQQQQRGFVSRPDPVITPLAAVAPPAPPPPKVVAEATAAASIPPKLRTVAPANESAASAPAPPPPSSNAKSGPPLASAPGAVHTCLASSKMSPPSPPAAPAPASSPIAPKSTTNKPESPMPQSPMPQSPMPLPQKPKVASTPHHVQLKGSGDDAARTSTERTSDANSKSNQESPEIRLQRELLRAEKEKTDAYRQVRLLEEELQKSRHREVEEQNQVGFMSPVTTMVASASRRRVRTPTPHPKKSKGKKNKPSSKKDERRYQSEAVAAIPYEYFSPDEDPDYPTVPTKFTIRRPYGMVEGQHDRQLWMAADVEVNKKYERIADVKKPWTLDVVGQVEVDGSLMVVTGKDRVKFLRNGTGAGDDGAWEDFGEIHARNRPLGVVTYIDTEADEKEYDLDDIAGMALAAREHYCNIVLSTAAFIRDRPAAASTPTPALSSHQQSPLGTLSPPQPKSPTSDACVGTDPAAAEMVPPAAPSPRAETADACVGTEDMKFPPSAESAAETDEKSEETAGKEKAPSSPRPEDDDSGSDVLGVFVGMLFSTVAWLLWNVFVRIPFRVLTTAFVFSAAAILLSLLWLYLEDDHGAEAMGATLGGVRYNPPGIL